MKAIWEVNLKRIQGYRDDIDPNINDILSYPDELWYQLEQEGRTQWNGRQIRNAFQTALALAENDHFKQHPELLGEDQPNMKKVRLEKKHFTTVATNINTFDDYLGTTHHGNSHSKIAYDRGQRADNYGQQTKQRHYHASPKTSGYQSYNRGGGYAVPTPPPSWPTYGGGPPPSPSAGGNAPVYYVPVPPNHSPSSGYPVAPPPQPGRGMPWPPSQQQQHNRGQQDHNTDQNPTQQYDQHQPEHPLVHRAPDDDEFA
ncbi:hypothetical protein MPH_00216 [Macrophomina phaseolina MS6]|uniref:AAA+ ATPase lid domain-containing protein n=1 Tax=Macrophomina phaseolina (strain MS6) TaxID=1126212 RepID=K2RIT7_MACPH|nr:hypothetical protein MPH_00216 [Macrophomina phaseolina MS6]